MRRIRVVAALIEPALTAVFERYKMITSIADLMATGAQASFHLVSMSWFAWIAGVGIGLTCGFTVGVWLDAILRRRGLRRPAAVFRH